VGGSGGEGGEREELHIHPVEGKRFEGNLFVFLLSVSSENCFEKF